MVQSFTRKTLSGALTVAARESDAFEPPARDMIHLVARQIAIKLDLADAHEKIREMARTDAMTGLATERTFLRQCLYKHVESSEEMIPCAWSWLISISLSD